MLTINLTDEEIRFLDQYFREIHIGSGVATKQLHDRDIWYSYDLFGAISYLWDQQWMARDREFPYPQQDDHEVLCPWETREIFLSRVSELETWVKEVNRKTRS